MHPPLPATPAWPAPLAESLRHGLDAVLAHLAAAPARPPMPTGEPLADALLAPDALLPAAPVATDVLLGRLRAVLDGSMNPWSPGYVGHMDTVAAPMSLVGDLAASAVNNNMLSDEMSPALSRLERALVRAIAGRFGLGDAAGGVLTAGGSLANLLALAAARNRAFGARRDGIVGLARRPVLLASTLAHSSLEKSAMFLGLGTDAVIPVATDPAGRMDAAALDAAIVDAVRRGTAPFAVVATAGTTVLGSVDPLAAAADAAARHGLWLHVDAAYGGALLFSGRERARLAGIERADSVTFNPQKWCWVAKTCAMALFRDGAVLERDVRVGAPYMRDAGGPANLGELGPQGTRRADALKLWLTLQQLGGDGIGAHVERGMRLARRMAGALRARPAFELAVEPELNLVCFRLALPAASPAERDAANAALQQRLLREHGVFLSLPTYQGARWLRAALLHPALDDAAIDAIVARLDAAGAA